MARRLVHVDLEVVDDPKGQPMEGLLGLIDKSNQL